MDDDPLMGLPDDDAFSDINELLNQGDIDALLEEASAPPGEMVIGYDGKRFPRTAKIRVETYDFRNPVFLTETELRQMRMRNESFINYLNARLSMFLRMDVNLKMGGLETMTYAKFTETIPTPIHINLFKIDQLTGVGVLDINARLALTIVNRMLGGKGNSIHEERNLTEIEMALIDDVVMIILNEWCKQWEDVKNLSATILGRENNGRFLQTSPHEAVMLVLNVEAALGDCQDKFQIAVPYYMVEPVIKDMQEQTRKFGYMSSSEKSFKWQDSYNTVNVPVAAEWDAFRLKVKDLLSLEVGDVLELPDGIMSKTKLRVENSCRFIGEVGVEGERVALKILEQVGNHR